MNGDATPEVPRVAPTRAQPGTTAKTDVVPTGTRPFLTVKRLVSKVLSARAVGSLISQVTRDRVRSFGLTFDVSDPRFTSRSKARLFFRQYEAAEIRLIRRNFAGINGIIEIGSGLGITGSLLLSVATPTAKLVAVEANPDLERVLTKTLHDHRREDQHITVTTAGLTPAGRAFFRGASDHVASTVTTNPDDGPSAATEVPAVTLASLTSQLEGVKRPYGLVMDIEGGEHAVIAQESDRLRLFDVILLELHDHESYSWTDALNRMRTNGWVVADSHGRSVVFTRSDS